MLQMFAHAHANFRMQIRVISPTSWELFSDCTHRLSLRLLCRDLSKRLVCLLKAGIQHTKESEDCDVSGPSAVSNYMSQILHCAASEVSGQTCKKKKVTLVDSIK